MFNTDGTKYHPLFEHLLFNGHGQVTMTFAEIEGVMEARLPPSAHTREEWWSNSPNGHSQARAWMRAGYATSQVDLAGQKVTFTLEGWPDGYQRSNLSGAAVGAGPEESPQTLLDAGVKTATSQGAADHPLFGIWVGKVTLLPGHDYTRPAFDPDDILGG